MKHRIILLSTLVLVSFSFAMAQDDDVYFSQKRAKKEKAARKVEIVYEEDTPEEYTPVTPVAYVPAEYPERDVDDYNRRGRSSRSSVDTLTDVARSTDSLQFSTRQASTYELSAQSLYDLGYSEGYRQGFDDGEDMDYYYGVRLARFHGRHFYDPWYWGSISYVYDPWYWNTWYYDPWYRPYYYGGWCSVGWGVGHWGSYWDPYWHGWHTPYGPHHHHPPHWGVNYGPRYSTVRNRDYGRPRIVDRSTQYGHSTSRGDRNGAVGRTDGVRNDRNSRINQRSTDRYNRATERANYRNTERATNRNNRNSTRVDRTTSRTNRSTVDRSSNRNNSRNENRSFERSTSRSSSRVGSSSSTSSRSSGNMGGGGGRSMGGSRGGRGR